MISCPHCGREIETDLLGKPVQKGTIVHEFITAYCEEFKVRRGTNPVPNAGAAKNIVKAAGKNEAIRLMCAYLDMKDQFFISRGYDLQTLFQNLTRVKVFADTGQTSSRGQAQQSERGAANAAAIRKAIERNGG